MPQQGRPTAGDSGVAAAAVPAMPWLAVNASVKVEVFSEDRAAEQDRMVWYSENGSVSGGSGTHLGGGLVITNRHVGGKVGRKAQVTFPRTPDDRRVAAGAKYSGQVVAVCDFADLAAIYCPDAAKEPAVDLADAAAAPGAHVFSAGYPGEAKRQLVREYGTMVRVERRPQSGFLSSAIKMHSAPGDSGSGIFAEDGSLVGVLWGGYQHIYDDTAAVTYEDTRRFVTERCTNWYLGKLLGRPDPNGPNGPKAPQPPPTASKPPMATLTPPVAAKPDPAPPSVPVAAKADPRLDALIASVAALQVQIAAIPAGPKGDPGTPGKNGVDGKPGRDGKDGQPGSVGPTGPAGESIVGPAGKPGKDADMSRVAALEAQVKALTETVSKLQSAVQRVRVVPAQP